jgi:hypothetical protein
MGALVALWHVMSTCIVKLLTWSFNTLETPHFTEKSLTSELRSYLESTEAIILNVLVETVCWGLNHAQVLTSISSANSMRAVM